jgi:hypothetical protein
MTEAAPFSSRMSRDASCFETESGGEYQQAALDRLPSRQARKRTSSALI